jgi:hypothetical protein
MSEGTTSQKEGEATARNLVSDIRGGTQMEGIWNKVLRRTSALRREELTGRWRIGKLQLE